MPACGETSPRWRRSGSPRPAVRALHHRPCPRGGGSPCKAVSGFQRPTVGANRHASGRGASSPAFRSGGPGRRGWRALPFREERSLRDVAPKRNSGRDSSPRYTISRRDPLPPVPLGSQPRRVARGQGEAGGAHREEALPRGFVPASGGLEPKGRFFLAIPCDGPALRQSRPRGRARGVARERPSGRRAPHPSRGRLPVHHDEPTSPRPPPGSRRSTEAPDPVHGNPPLERLLG
jgi:hypothetical protein